MPHTKQIRKNQEFFEKLENSDYVENNELMLKNTYTTLIGLLNQIEKQIGKVPVYEKSTTMSTTFRRKRENLDTDTVDIDNEGVKSVEKGLNNPFGMIIELNNDLLKNYFDLEEFKAKLVETPLNQRRLIILDFSGLTKLSSMEIGQLINLNEVLKGEGTFAIAMYVNQQVEILLHMMGVESMFLMVKDFDDMIERLVGDHEFIHLAGDETPKSPITSNVDHEEDTTRIIYEIKEKFDKARGIHRPAVKQPRHVKLSKRSIMTMSGIIFLAIILGYVWMQFFMSISKPEMPTKDQIDAHKKELMNELEIKE